MKHCKYCDKDVAHEFSHRTSRTEDSSRKIYKDDAGRFWEAARCPDCSGKYRQGRPKQKARDNSDGLPKPQLTDKKCTVCSCNLPEGRRYMHEKCQTIMAGRYYDIGAYYVSAY